MTVNTPTKTCHCKCLNTPNNSDTRYHRRFVTQLGGNRFNRHHRQFVTRPDDNTITSSFLSSSHSPSNFPPLGPSLYPSVPPSLSTTVLLSSSPPLTPLAPLLPCRRLPSPPMPLVYRLAHMPSSNDGLEID